MSKKLCSVSRHYKGMITVVKAYIGLGSNLGDRSEYFKQALSMLAQYDSIELVAKSSIIETTPVGSSGQGDYLNAVAQVNTTLDAESLYAAMEKIENSLGRERIGQKWQSRTIDLDLLLFGDEIIRTSKLAVPHKQMHLRSFVLDGLCELDAELVHPVFNCSIDELTRRLNGKDFVIDEQVPQLVSIAGVIGAGKTTLASALGERFDCPLIEENYGDNPFMPDVYAGKKDFALDSQLFFLMSRVEQLAPAAFAPGEIAVSDYLFAKEMIYAKAWLDATQMELYEKVYQGMSQTTVSPALVVYIKAEPDLCLERIHNRNRPYEQKIDRTFLVELFSEYESLFQSWTSSPVITISASEVDFREPGEVDSLAEQIKQYVKE